MLIIALVLALSGSISGTGISKATIALQAIFFIASFQTYQLLALLAQWKEIYLGHQLTMYIFMATKP